MPLESLFQPFTCKSLTLKNRFVMAPMSRFASPNGTYTDQMRAYYRRRAENDVGLLLSECSGIERPASSCEPVAPLFHGAHRLAEWQKMIDGVHAAGGKMAPQLWHAGGAAVPDWVKDYDIDQESPSGLNRPGKPLGHAMSDEDIADTIAAFAKAAGLARKMGFDCVEIHGAHGYLIDQFFWGAVNRRDDRYGGNSLPLRARFAADVIRAVRKEVGEDFVILLRLSQWKKQDYTHRMVETPADLDAWLRVLVDAGADIFHCSQRRFWEAEFAGSDLNFAGWARRLTGKPSITVGSVGLSGDLVAALTKMEEDQPASLDELVRRFERGDFDLVAVGRALLVDPAWLVKIRDGRMNELKPYTRAAHDVIY